MQNTRNTQKVRKFRESKLCVCYEYSGPFSRLWQKLSCLCVVQNVRMLCVYRIAQTIWVRKARGVLLVFAVLAGDEIDELLPVFQKELAHLVLDGLLLETLTDLLLDIDVE